VFVALAVQHAMRVNHVVIRGLSGYTNFFKIISQAVGFLKKKSN
jgi:hypothetical protein